MTLGALLHPFCPPARERFIRIVRGEGAVIEDDAGNRYIDGMGALWYANVGYGRTEIADAVRAQMDRIAAYHLFEPFSNEPAEQLAEEIAAIAPVDDPRVFFTNSGSESVDTAMKLARIAQVRSGHPERTVIVSRGRGYHGTNYGGMTAQGLPLNREGFGPYVEGVVNLPADDIEAMASFLAEHGSTVAAVLSEPVQGAAGVYPPPPGYIEGLRRLCDQHGCLLILDEVICGFGRLGTWFGAERFGVRPDMITFAKGVTSGYIPLGGVIVGAKVRAPLESDPAWMLRHGYTYSGHPTACAAGLANLKILRDERLIERAPAIGDRLSGGLRSLLDDGAVAEVRGMGGMWAVGLRPDQDASVVRDRMFERGAIARAIGAATLTWCPPLVISDEQVDQLVDALAMALQS